MEVMMSFCGLLCNECPTFLATRNDDDVMRTKTAERWSKEYWAKIKPNDINCDGCQTDSDNVFGHCKICEIRKCGREKGLDNCAHCGDYSCEKLEMIFNMVPDTKKKLDGIRSSLIPKKA